MTHSLVVGAVAAVGFALAADRTPMRRLAGGVLLVGLVVLAARLGGPLTATAVTLYCLAGAVVATVAGRRYAIDTPTLVVVALLALLSHPFGDLLTGQPPAFLYPLSGPLVTERVALAADPTLHLLATFTLEVAAVWLAVIVAARLGGWQLTARLTPRAVTGCTCGAAVVVLAPPTLAAPYTFTATVLVLGTAVAVSHWLLGGTDRRRTASLTALLDGTATVTVALTTYTAAYLALAA
jgi:hypothetical protein